MRPKKPAPRKTAFVPRMIFRAAVTGVGVVPFCAAAGLMELDEGCSSSSPALGVAAKCFCDGSTKVSSIECCNTMGQNPDGTVVGSGDAREDVPSTGVADVGFSVADIGFSVADVGFSVADVGFTDTSSTDVTDAHVTDTGPADVMNETGG
jgi:hypothetical protein